MVARKTLGAGSFIGGLGVLSILLALAPSALAQTVPETWHYWQHEAGDWTFIPAYGPDRVEGFLARLPPELGTGENITTIWYARQPDDTWFAWGWQQASLAEVVIWIRDAWMDPTFFEENFTVWCALATAPEDTVGIAPLPMHSGLFINDPLLPMLPLIQDPEQFVDSAAGAGYQAAPLLSSLSVSAGGEIQPIDPIDPCEPSEASELDIGLLLQQLAFRAEIFAFGSSETVDPDPCGFICSGCTSSITKTQTFTFLGFTQNGSAKICAYSRTVTTTIICTGKKLFGCGTCPNSTSACTDTVTKTILPDTPCPPAPPPPFATLGFACD